VQRWHLARHVPVQLSLPLGTNAITAIDSGSSGFAAPIECAVGRVNSATTSVQAETVTGMNGSTALATTTIVPGRPAAPLTMLTATAAAGKGVTPVYGNRKHCEEQTRQGYNHNLYCPTLTWSRDRNQRLRWARIQMTGLQVSRAANPPGSGYGAHVPIVEMTVSAMSEERDLCLAAGMDDFISTPVNYKGLEIIITATF
jgi:hypothetical protein